VEVKCGHNCGAQGLKGLHITAQGNALGHGQPHPTHRPVRAGHFGYSRHYADTGSQEKRRHVVPLQGGIVRGELVPRALPWAVVLLPLSGRSDGKPNITGTSQGSHQAVYNCRFGDKLKDVTSNFPGEAAAVYYQYDGLGKRRSKTLDSVNTTWWRWERNRSRHVCPPAASKPWLARAARLHGKRADWDLENLSLTYIPGLAEVTGTNPSTGSYRYYMGDHLGSVRGIRAQDKSSLASYEYMPYGEVYNQTGLALNRGFTGHAWDKDDGLYYAPYRYYSPVASRWLTRDPAGIIDGPNLYSYVNDNPTMFTDYLGLSARPNYICKPSISDTWCALMLGIPWQDGCEKKCCFKIRKDCVDKAEAQYAKDVAKCAINKNPPQCLHKAYQKHRARMVDCGVVLPEEPPQ